MNNNRFSRLFENKHFMMFLSVCIALVLWGYVVVYVNNEHTTTIRNVPINMQYRQSVYQSMGLDVIETDIDTVNVSVTGPRSVTGELTADDIIVYPNITGVDSAGKYTLKLTAEKTSSVKNFKINSLSHDNVTVMLDKMVSKEFPIETDISTVVVSGDSMADRPTPNPSTITITGPEYKVNSISRVVAATLSTEVLSQTAVLKSEIRLFDENDGLLDKNLLSFSSDNVDITVPIMKEVVLPIKVEYTNVPDGFDTATLQQSLSQDTIRLAVPAQNSSRITEVVAGYIDLAALQTDTRYEFDIKLPTGCRSLDDISSVSATISSQNLTERTVAVSEIKVINDAGGDIEVLTQVINNVVVVGQKEVVDSLTDGSIIAQIDASRLSAAQGQQSVAVQFIIPSTSAAYVKGIYSATIRI